MTSNKIEGYDIIGDIHGCASDLELLLADLGYRDTDGSYRHPSRRVIFVGDLIDRGPQQLLVLQIVKAMVDTGNALMVLGNHEFNALAYDTEWPARSGKFLRPHDDPTSPWAAKNEKQHKAFLDQVKGDERAHYLAWLWTVPLWLDLRDLRVVHACWHQPSIDVMTNALGGNTFTSIDQLIRASTKGDPIYDAVETLLKGPEISLEDHGQPAYVDKDGIARGSARLRWWNSEAVTLRDTAEMGGRFTTADGQPYPPLPEIEVAQHQRSHIYTDQVPVFYGHYWRIGPPTHLQDWTEYTACVDFSAVKGGALMAYRWSGEKRIAPEHYVSVGTS